MTRSWGVMRRTPAARLRLLLVLALASSSSSCLLLDMTSLTVVSWKPGVSQLSSVSSVVIQLVFSRPVNALLTEQAFSITADDASLAGRVSWTDSRTLLFTPEEPLKDYVVYRLHVSRQAEDTEGRDLYPEFDQTFTTKTDSVRPTVASASPVDHQGVSDPLVPITITFSEAMDAASVYAAFSCSPDAKGFLFLSGTALTFTPTEKLQWQTRYTITVAKSAADLQHNTLGTDYTLHLFVGTDTVAPTVASLKSSDGSITLAVDDPSDSVITVTAGFESTQGVVVTFSEPVLTSTALTAVTILPTVDHQVQEENTELTSTLTFSFPGRLVHGQTYSLDVAAGIQDAQGNRSANPASYNFLVDGPLSAPPVVTRVAYAGDTADPSANVLLSAYGAISLSAVAAGTVDTFFDVYVDLAQGAVLDPLVVGQAFSVSTTNNAASFTAFAVQVSPAQTNPTPDAAADEVVARVWVHITNNSSSGQVVIHLSTALADGGGATLTQEFVLPLNDPA